MCTNTQQCPFICYMICMLQFHFVVDVPLPSIPMSVFRGRDSALGLGGEAGAETCR